jgi:hypothetical protein
MIFSYDLQYFEMLQNILNMNVKKLTSKESKSVFSKSKFFKLRKSNFEYNSNFEVFQSKPRTPKMDIAYQQKQIANFVKL